jgi:hypothetical protein
VQESQAGVFAVEALAIVVEVDLGHRLAAIGGPQVQQPIVVGHPRVDLGGVGDRKPESLLQHALDAAGFHAT